MAYLLAGDLVTHGYQENIDEITRGDNTIVYEAIEAAIAEAKSYLARYDLLKLFGNDDTEPSHTDENLKRKVKDIAWWHLLTLCNANVSLDLARTKYEDAVRWFEQVSNRKVNPLFPMPQDDVATDSNESKSIEWDSNPKRYNHF